MAELRPRPSRRLAFLAFLCLLLLAAPPRLALARAAPSADSIHKLLRSHGLPGGLLPRSVASYTLDEGNGLLEARLSAPCYATYDNGDLAFFDTVVRGNLSFGRPAAARGWLRRSSSCGSR
ncbi:hypothetical protein ZWY2020_024035 [Hordeum vulgare]|nr:hypothetical protein ZWY2020_024035 [Hordeum vulgare]